MPSNSQTCNVVVMPIRLDSLSFAKEREVDNFYNLASKGLYLVLAHKVWRPFALRSFAFLS